jgi:ribose transport system substrate-binding protein
MATACSSTTPEQSDDSGITIAIVPKALDNPIFNDTRDGGTAKANELGITLEWIGSSVANAAEQIQVIEALIEKGVDGILISCNDAGALRDVINKAVDAGIAVATFDSDSPDSNRAFFIASDNTGIGRKCAEVINELLPGGGKIAVLSGVADAPNLNERIAGLRTAVNSNIEILPIQYCDDDIQKAVDIINSFTAANPDLAGWVFVGGWPFNAEPDALYELRRFTEAGGVVVSVDTMEPMLQFVRLGMAQTLIGQDYYKMGYEGVQRLHDMIQNGRVTTGFIDTGYVVIDKTNVDN